MEFVLYSLYQVDVRNLVKNKLIIARDYHIQPSEIDKLVFFEYEYILEDITKEQKEAEKKNKEEQKQYSGSGKVPNYNQISSSLSRSMPSLPKITIPKL